MGSITTSFSSTRPDPPGPVRFLGWAAIVMGVWFLFSSVVFGLIFKPSVIEPPVVPIRDWIFGLGGATFYFLCGVGLLALRNWARYGFIVLMAWLLPYICKSYIAFAYRLLHGGVFVRWYEVLASLVLAAGILPFYAIWLLTRFHIRKAFIERNLWTTRPKEKPGGGPPSNASPVG